MKKFTLRDIYESKEAWQKLCALPKPIKMAYDTGKYFSRTILPEVQQLQQQQQAMLIELGTPDAENPGMVQLKDGSAQAVEFNKRWNELMATEVELPLVSMPFSELLDALLKKPGLETSDDVLILTEPFFGEAPKPTAG